MAGQKNEKKGEKLKKSEKEKETKSKKVQKSAKKVEKSTRTPLVDPIDHNLVRTGAYVQFLFQTTNGPEKRFRPRPHPSNPAPRTLEA